MYLCRRRTTISITSILFNCLEVPGEMYKSMNITQIKICRNNPYIRGLASPRGVFYGARLCSGRRPERSPEAPKGPRVSWLRRKLLLGPEAWARYTAVTTVDEPPRARRALGGESVTAKCPKGKRTSFCNFACQPPTICFHGLAIFHVEIWVSSRCLNRTKIWTSHV